MDEEKKVYHIEFDATGDITFLIYWLTKFAEPSWEIIGGADGVHIEPSPETP